MTKRDELLKEVDALETVYGDLLTKLDMLSRTCDNKNQRIQLRLLSHAETDNMSAFCDVFRKELKDIHKRLDDMTSGVRTPEKGV